ncbi:MAG TPA: transglycosylase SLT domain-containing protein [Longimicrobiaceae bacterium]|nr:transglycosylase SLT domain-containing protein [Longimicrobiaceae bacterium]
MYPQGSRAWRVVGLGALALLMGYTPAQPPQSTPAPVPADTGEVPIFRLRAPSLFHATYLSRVAEAARERDDRLGSSAAIDSLIRETRIASYAKRFHISHSLAEEIVDIALDEGVDPELAFRLVHTESRFKAHAHGPSGAVGLTQLMFGTARSIDRSVDSRSDLLDPSLNLHIGLRYLHQMIERYDGNVRLGVLAYNRGEVAVDRALRRGHDPENGYSHRVLGTRGSNPYHGTGVVEKK